MNSSSVDCSIEPSFFEYKGHDKEKGYDVFTLDSSKLCEDEYHMFFPRLSGCNYQFIAAALEIIAFPENKEMNDKLNFKYVKCNGNEIAWCSFAKEFKDLLERVAKGFSTTIQVKSRTMAFLGPWLTYETVLVIPAHENVLCFEPGHSIDRIAKECEKMVRDENSCETEHQKSETIF